MSTYAQVIYLFFKKKMGIGEIANFMPDQLMKYRPSASQGSYESPIKAAQAIIGFEVAAWYKMGAFNKYEEVNKFNRYHNQKLSEYKHQKIA